MYLSCSKLLDAALEAFSKNAEDTQPKSACRGTWSVTCILLLILESHFKFRLKGFYLQMCSGQYCCAWLMWHGTLNNKQNFTDDPLWDII